MSHVARESEGSLGVSNASARGFGTAGVAREQDKIRTVIGEKLGDGFADSH
jgi:hypothetical protein